MKKIVSILLALFLCLGIGSVSAFAAEYEGDYDEPYYYLGDVNMDDWTDNQDALMILKYDIGLEELSDEALELGDVNYDGVVDNTDALLVLKYDAGIIYDFCVEHEWSESCTTPKFCMWCGLTVGEAEGHDLADGACTKCGYTETKESAARAIADFVMENGALEEGIYALVSDLSDTEVFLLMYDPELPETLMFSYVMETETEAETVVTEWNVCNAEQEAIYLYANDTAYDMGFGTIDMASFNATSPDFSEFEASSAAGAEIIKAAALDKTVTMLIELDELLTDANIGYTLADLGYTAF